MKTRLILASAVTAATLAATVADACSRAVYFGEEGQTITGRTMDWFVSDMDTNQWLYPRGLERTVQHRHAARLDVEIRQRRHHDLRRRRGRRDERGRTRRQPPLSRRSRVHAGGRRRHPAHAPDLGLGAIHARQLRHHRRGRRGACAQESFRVVPIAAPTGEPGTVHLSVSDASGDSAIFEFIDGKLVIHHGREYQIMTNSPTYDQQLALAAYWKNIGGSVMLPGTNRAADRFARMSYYINEATQTADPRRAVATVFSIMRNVSVPIGIKVPGQPNIADTLWLTVSDQKNKVYYYQDTNSPGIIWTNLAELDFSEGSGPRKLQLDGNPDLAGDQTANFQPAELFKFISPDAPH